MMATRIMQDIRRQVAEGEARGKVRGKAEGMVEAIRQLVRSGALTVDAGHAQVKALLKAKLITREMATAAKLQPG